MNTKSLTSKRLMVTKINPDQGIAATMVGWLNDPEITKYSEQRHKKHTIRTQMSYIRKTELLWGIYRMDTMGLIGSISAHYDSPNNVANVGIMIGDKENMGKGFGFEAWKTVCDDLMYFGSVRKIEAGCMAINRPMMSICSKYGMMEEGRQQDHFIYRDFAVDLVHWGKIKDAG